MKVARESKERFGRESKERVGREKETVGRESEREGW